MKTFKILIAALLAASIVFAMASCSSDKTNSKNTTVTTEKKVTTSSARTKVESDYDIKDVDDLTVPVGTSEDDVKSQLPANVDVLMKGTPTGTSETLFTESFESIDSFSENWNIVGPEGIVSIENGAMATTVKSNYFRTYLKDQPWMNIDSDDYANYVVRAVVQGHEQNPSNNFGIIFRTTNVLENGPDGYDGIYVGIGDPSGQVCIGCAQNNWTQIFTYDFDYLPEQNYTIEVVVFNDKYAVLLDNELIYEGECVSSSGTPYINGTVGIRTYEQLFSCSEFSVRTLGASDYEHFEDGYTYYESHPVEWSCTDYNPSAKGKYGFVGKVTDLENAYILAIVQVKEDA